MFVRNRITIEELILKNCHTVQHERNFVQFSIQTFILLNTFTDKYEFELTRTFVLRV